MSRSASRRDLPTRTSASARRNSSVSGPGSFSTHLRQRGVEAETGPNGDRQQVERVRDHLEDDLLAGLDPPAQPELRQHVADEHADQAEDEALQDARPDEQAEQQEDDHAGDEGDQHLHAHPVGQAQVARVAGHGQSLLGDVRSRKRSTGATPTRDSRAISGRRVRSANGCCSSSSSRLLGLEAAQLGQSSLDRVDRCRRWRGR